MKQLKNSLNYKIVFRCDAAHKPEIGTGHLYRCVRIANYLKNKFKITKNQIIFIIKYDGKYLIAQKILRKYGYNYYKLDNKIKDNSAQESTVLSKFKSKLLIIDRLGKTNKIFVDRIKKNYRKKIIIEDSSSFRNLFDLSINSLIRNVKKDKNSKIGFKFLLLSNKKISSKKIKKNNIFLFFGGFDKNNYQSKILKLLNLINFRLNIFISKSNKYKIYKKISKHRVDFFDTKSFENKLKSSNIVFNSGGLGLFDSILMNKKIICLPQYNHQKINAKTVSELGAIKLFTNLSRINKKKIIHTFLSIYDDKNYESKVFDIQKKIINYDMVKRNYNMISYIYKNAKI